MSLLEVRGAGFGYNEQAVFKDINLSISRGEIFCLIGPNGCGKTTLLDCVMGILSVRDGSILLEGKNIKGTSSRDIARRVAYVPQVHERTFPYTVLDIVLMGRTPYTGFFASPSARDVEIVERSLELVGLAGFEDRQYTRLSGGECQLVMIARALAQQTQLIIMDEPTAHLDFKHELNVLETIIKLVRETSLAVIMSTHFPNHAFYLENNNVPTHVALMQGNTFLSVGRPDEVLSEENLRLLYNINAKVVSCRIDNDTELKQIIPVSTVA